MLSVNVVTSLDIIQTPTAIALGNFDGIHRGHRRVIDPMLASPVGIRTVVSFHPHPQEWFTGESRALLTPLDEKSNYLRSIGVEQFVLLNFDHSLATLSPESFVKKILLEQLQAKSISVGQNFRFGHRRSGNIADLRAIASQYGLNVYVADLHRCGNERISSSAIREALSQGDLKRANRLLGRPYELRGTVVRGQQLGRTIGFPTANLKIPDNKFCPRQGVYSVQVQILKSETKHVKPDELLGGFNDSWVPGVMNLGNRPTVEGGSQTVEVHLLDWKGDLYGQSLYIQLNEFLRPEQKFDSLNELKAQIQIDCDVARALHVSSSIV